LGCSDQRHGAPAVHLGPVSLDSISAMLPNLKSL
jgi:hypothetical protein